MRSQISYSVLAAALLGGAPIANAQDVVPQPLPPGTVVVRPVPTVETVPVETVETVQTVRSAGHTARRSNSHHAARNRPERIVTTTTRRTILGERVVPAPAVVAPAPLDAVAEPTYAETPASAYPRRLYDVATEPVFGAPVAPAYRYIYEPDRILVIDPATGIAVQAIPR